MSRFHRYNIYKYRTLKNLENSNNYPNEIQKYKETGTRLTIFKQKTKLIFSGYPAPRTTTMNKSLVKFALNLQTHNENKNTD